MSTTRQRFLSRGIGAAVCAVVALVLVSVSIWHAAAMLAVGAVVLAILTLRASASYRAARLISENPILNVGMAHVSTRDDDDTTQSTMNVVISGFGILMDGKPYTFGRNGTKLTDVSIDRESIELSFGDEGKAYSVNLLHGIADKADIDALVTRLRYETGVVAKVGGW